MQTSINISPEEFNTRADYLLQYLKESKLNGVVLFDSVTHVVKDMAEKTVAVEKVAADLLEARAGGGTGGQESIKLALRNFEDTKAKEKIFIVPNFLDIARYASYSKVVSD